MRTAGRRLAHDGHALQSLQIVGKLLGRRERVRGGEDIDRFVATEAPPGERVLCPVVVRAVELNASWTQNERGGEGPRWYLVVL